jgi:hypothetical protein
MDDKTLVTKYLKRKKLLDGDVESARGRSEDLALAADLGEVGIDLAANSFGDVMQRRAGWNQSSAGAPIARPEYKSDLSSIKSMGQRDLQAAQERRNQGIQDFDAEQKLTDLQTKRTRDEKEFEWRGAEEKHKADKRPLEIDGLRKDLTLKGQSVEKGSLSLDRDRRATELDKSLYDPNSPVSASLRRMAQAMDKENAAQYENMSGAEIGEIRPALLDSLKLRTAEAKAASGSGESSKLNNEFEKQLADYRLSGNGADIAKNISQLREIAKQARSSSTLSGPAISILGDGIKDRVAPEAADLRDRYLNLTMGSLKQLLGSAFTEKDREIVLQQAFNPRLSPAQNAARMERMADRIEEGLRNKEDAIRFYEQEGKIDGFKGRLYTSGDFQNMPDEPVAPTPPPGGRVIRNKRTGEYKVLDANGNEVK